jgi:hypothetical protein
VRSRERRVKVKRGLFSYLGEEHLPSQNDHPNIKCPLAMQVIAKMTFVGNLEFQHPGSPELFGANKCTFLHIDCRTLLYIRKQPQVEIRLRLQDPVAATNSPRPSAACPAGSDTAARAR